MEFKSLILDFGGVLLNIDYEAPIREFKKLGIENFETQFQKAQQSSFMDDFERGIISNDEFFQKIKTLSGLKITNELIQQAWNSILLDFPSHKMELLKILSEKYDLYLLSNTNRIHVASFEKEMNRVYGQNYFHQFFKKIYYSSSIGMRKPDQEIFNLVLSENNLNKKEVCFIDDSIQHIRGAKSIGIPSFYLDLTKEDLKDLLIRENLI